MVETATNGEVKLQRTATGKKPQYFQDPIMDRLLSMVLELMGELSVVRDRLDTVERLIEANNLFKQEEIDNYQIPEDVDFERTERREAYIARVLKSVLDEVDLLNQRPSTQQPRI